MRRHLHGIIAWDESLPHALCCEHPECDQPATWLDDERDVQRCAKHSRPDDVKLTSEHVRAQLWAELVERHVSSRKYRRYRLREMVAWLRERAETSKRRAA